MEEDDPDGDMNFIHDIHSVHDILFCIPQYLDGAPDILSLGTRGAVLRSVAETVQGTQHQKVCKAGRHILALSWGSQGMGEVNTPPSDEWQKVPG